MCRSGLHVRFLKIGCHFYRSTGFLHDVPRLVFTNVLVGTKCSALISSLTQELILPARFISFVLVLDTGLGW